MITSNFFTLLMAICAVTGTKIEAPEKNLIDGFIKDNSRYWLVSCTLSGCSFAFSSCIICFGESECKSCITLNKLVCEVCADEIYNNDNLETLNGNKYLTCDPGVPIQSKVCHLYCRGQNAQSGQCVRENNLSICKCSSGSRSISTDLTVSTNTQPPKYSTTTLNSTLSQNKPQFHFNGSVKFNISISRYERILPLPNGNLVRGSSGNLIEIWDLHKEIIKRNLTSVYSLPWVFGLLSNGDLVAGYLGNKTILVWDLKITNGEPLKRIIQTNETFYCLTVLKNDDLAIGQSENGFDIIIRDSQNELIKKKLVGHTLVVYQIIELPNGNLVSSSHDKTVKVWNISNGAEIKSITHGMGVRSIAFLPNGFLVSGLYDGTINIWNLEKNQLIRNLKGHLSSICENNCLHVLANGHLLSGSYDKTIKIWNPSDGTVKLTSPLLKDVVGQLAVLQCGNFISSSRYDLIVWN